MERIEAINGETQLPREIIHHIQSFLDGKEAVRTTILSKSWCEAWLTRPNLILSEADLPTTPFMDFGKNTIQRYEELNLKIQSFKLLIDLNSSKDYLSDRISLAEDWTRKAIKLRATDIDIQISCLGWESDSIFVLPQEVFESETLVKLSLVGNCRIDLKGKKVNCSRLKSLQLGTVCIEGSDNILNIISIMCPLIEELVLSNCSYHNSGSYEKLVLKSGLGMNSFRKLKVLSFEYVVFGEGFFHDFSSKFPRVEDLGLDMCDGWGEIQICSDSVERISFTNVKFNVLKFNVPSIKKFKFLRSSVPSVSFKTTSTEWESRISICWCLVISGFAKLRKFLQELSPSKIYLDLCSIAPRNEHDYTEDLIRLPKPPTVEKLTVHLLISSSFHSVILESLFWICRPNFLDLQLWPCSISKPLSTNSSDLMKLLCNIPIEEGNENPNMSDLEEVKFDFFRCKDGGEWLPLSCTTLIEAFAISEDSFSEDMRIIICFQLKWGQSI